MIGQNDKVGIDDFEAPLFVTWQINSACNLNCLHCFVEAGEDRPDQMDREEMLECCRQLIDSKVPYIAITGGEPLLHPSFFEVSELLTDHGIELKVETNGQLIDQSTAAKFASLGFRSVQISVDGAKAETHEAVRSRGDWKKTIDGCRFLTAEGVNIEILFVPTKYNIGEVEAIVDMSASLGAYGFYTGRIMSVGNAAKNWALLCPSDKEYEKFFRILEDKPHEYKNQMKIFYYPHDVTREVERRLEHPTASLIILPNGKVKLIAPLPFVCGDLKRQTLPEVWQKCKDAWKDERVVEFARRLVCDQRLLAKANKLVEL